MFLGSEHAMCPVLAGSKKMLGLGTKPDPDFFLQDLFSPFTETAQ